MDDALRRLESSGGAVKAGSRQLCDGLESMVLKGDFDKLRVELDGVFALARLVPSPHLAIPDANTIDTTPPKDTEKTNRAKLSPARKGKDAPERADGEPRKQRQGIPKAEAEIRIRGWLTENAKANPGNITRDGIAAGTGVSTGAVSDSTAWLAFRDARDSLTKPRTREVPLSETMLASVPDDSVNAAALAALIKEQEQDRADLERSQRRKGRADPVKHSRSSA